MDRIKEMRCSACRLEGCQQPSFTEVHHLVDKGYREHSGGHDATIPLCLWHHRGEHDGQCSNTRMALEFGPSMALQKRAFVARYGTERELLAKVNKQLELEGVI